MKDYRQLTEQELSKLLEYHDGLYWEKAEPEIPDEEYDYIVRCLREKNPEHPLLATVHAPVVRSSGEKIRHSKPMLSLNKAYSLDEVIEWAGKNIRSSDEKFIIQPKYDGISANFENGVLATRGDGIFGEDITDKIPLIELEAPGYRGKLDRPSRGEIVIRNDDFENIYSKIKRADGSLYKNSRNAVAGIMGLKDISHIRSQGAKLTMVDYKLVSYTLKFSEFKEKWPRIVEEIESLPYPMDGIVIKLADEKYAESLGSTAHHPRSQIAYKFTGIKKETELLDVQWSFGKNCITPVAVMKPVEIGGITIKHASLHNIQNIIDKDIMIGDTVIVERAGDVIPYIVSSRPGKERKSCLIDSCPACNADLKRRGPEIVCTNKNCPEILLQRLLASVRSIGIERLGEPTLRKLIDNLNIQSLKDIFNLRYEDIIYLDGFKEKSASNMIKEINKARKVSDYQVLAAMNIPGIGPNVAKLILQHYSLQELRNISEEDLAEINGIGPERATWIVKTLKEESEVLDDILSAVELQHTDKNDSDSMPKICFTGKMPEKRSYYENLASEHGYEPVKTVTSDLKYLVMNDTNAGGSKRNKAEKYGIKIISLEDWLESLDKRQNDRNDNKTEQNDISAPKQLSFDF